MPENAVLYVSLGLLLLGLLLQTGKRRLFRSSDMLREKKTLCVSRTLFFAGIAFILGWYGYLVWAQYLAWKEGGPFLSLLVPPHQNIFYVVGYHFTRFAMYYVLSLSAALFLLFGGIAYNKAFDGRFFEPEEPYLAALSLFLLGNPEWHYLWIYYFLAVLAVAVFGLVAANVAKKENFRLSLYYLWIPLAIAGIIVVELVIK